VLPRLSFVSAMSHQSLHTEGQTLVVAAQFPSMLWRVVYAWQEGLGCRGLHLTRRKIRGSHAAARELFIAGLKNAHAMG
jgi:hypothetical protein